MQSSSVRLLVVPATPRSSAVRRHPWIKRLEEHAQECQDWRVPAKRGISRFITNRVVNPVVRRLLEHGLAPRTHALLETTGRKSGLPRRVPVGNGLRGDQFWIVTEHGTTADYVKNIQQDPHVRVKVGRRWRSGTAHLLPDDDVAARLRSLRRPVNDALVRLVGTEHLTVRIDLEP
jgi:deazaflavin-dependent oxidoreductase (nitroreductase family)